MTHETIFKIAEIRNAKDGEPKVVSYTIDQFVSKVVKPIDSPTPFNAYHHQKAEEKRLNAAARVARSAGQVDEANKLKAEAKDYKGYVDKTKTGPAWMPFIFKDDVTFKQVQEGWNQRDNDRITHFSMIMLDIESQITKEEIHTALAEYEYVLWPTITHKPDDPRFRVVLFPSKPLAKTAAQELILRIDAHLPARNDITKSTQAIDPASLDVGRLMYRPKWLHGHPEKYSHVHNQGKLITANSFQLTLEQQAALDARAKRQSEVKATTVQRATVVAQTTNPAVIVQGGKVWLNPDGELETEDGWVRVSDITTKISGVKCPVHDDNIGSEFAGPNQYTGRPQLVCAKCKATYRMLPMVGYRDDSDEAESTLVFNRRKGAKPTVEEPKIEKRKATTVEYFEQPDPVLNLNERYLSPDVIGGIPKDGLLAIRSPKGTGKTVLLKSLAAECRQHGHSHILIGHRVFLITRTAEDMQVANYQDLENGGTTDAMAICVNSLTRFNAKTDDPFHTIVIDESEQFFQALLNEKMRDLPIVFTNLIWLLRKAKRIVVLDADLTYDLTIDLINQIRPITDDFNVRAINNDYPIGQGQKTKLYADKFHLLNDALEDIAAGEKVFIASNSVNQATAISGIIKSMDKSCLLVTAATNDSEECLAFISAPTEESQKYDVIVSSPTLSTGVSIEGNHFTKVYGFFGRNPGTYQDADQALSRVRNCRDVSVWVEGNRNEPVLMSEEAIFDQAIEKERRAIIAMPDEEFSLTKGKRVWVEVYARLKNLVNRWSVNKDVKFTELRRSFGYTVEMVLVNKSSKANGRDIYNQFKDVGVDRTEEVFNAKTFDLDHQLSPEEQALELGRKRIKTREEKLQLERYRIEEYLHEDFTLENVRKALKQELLKSLSRARIAVINNQDHNAFLDKKERVRNGDIFTSNKHYHFKRELIDQMKVAAGIDPDLLLERATAKEEIEIPVETLAKVAEVYASRQKDFNFYFESRIKNPASPSNYMKIWNATFGDHASLPLVKKRRKSNKAVSMHYFIDLTKRDLVQKVIADAL